MHASLTLTQTRSRRSRSVCGCQAAVAALQRGSRASVSRCLTREMPSRNEKREREDAGKKGRERDMKERCLENLISCLHVSWLPSSLSLLILAARVCVDVNSTVSASLLQSASCLLSLAALLLLFFTSMFPEDVHHFCSIVC